MLPPGDRRHSIVQDWIKATMPWINLEGKTSEEYLVKRGKEQFGETDDGQQPK